MNNRVQKKFDTYPAQAAVLLKRVRQLILDTADAENISSVEETLKWGEPSYSVKGGSPIRFDYKIKKTEQYCIYFNCNTVLIETFRAVYGDGFQYDGNRALVFNLALEGSDLNEEALKHCLSMALQYKQLKHLPLLGA